MKASGIISIHRFKSSVPYWIWENIEIKSIEDCWNWGGKTNKGGYGMCKIYLRETLTHRVAYMCAINDIPKNMCVCHQCDNPKCCNPNHLFLGTNRDNAEDMFRKNRNAKQEAHGKATITNETALKIKAMSDSGMGATAIHRQLGVSMGVVSKIIYGLAWRSLFVNAEPQKATSKTFLNTHQSFKKIFTEYATKDVMKKLGITYNTYCSLRHRIKKKEKISDQNMKKMLIKFGCVLAIEEGWEFKPSK